MIRHPAREQLHRLTVKTLDQVSIVRAKEGLGCSQFEAEALTSLVKEVYFPWLSHPEAIRAGQLAMTAISVTKLDVLDTFEELQICAAYRLGDQVTDYVPDTATQEEVAPVYETWPGWMSDTSGCRTWDDLPANAQRYLKRIQERGLGALLLTLLAARQAMPCHPLCRPYGQHRCPQ